MADPCLWGSGPGASGGDPRVDPGSRSNTFVKPTQVEN